MLLVLVMSNIASASILWSGDVDPSDPSIWDSSTPGKIGNTGNGTLSITGGSDVINGYGIIGERSGSTGAVTVDGSGSTWINSDILLIGNFGDGTMDITGGGAVSSRLGHIAFESDSTSTVNVDGAGSTWTNGKYFYVGRSGNGTMNITRGGAVSNVNGHIGMSSGSTGTVNVDGSGSTWTNSGSVIVGYIGNGTLEITDGGVVSNYDYGRIASGADSTGTVTVDGSGSTWINSRELQVGLYGDATLNITNGGTVSSPYAYIGERSGSTGAVTVDGSGSTWTNDGNLFVGSGGNGTLEITDDGLVSVAGTLRIYNQDSFINMSTGGMLAVLGDAGESLVDFMGLIDGTDAIRYWDSSIANWADITGATYGIDYMLDYITEGDLAGHTMLTVPEPTTLALLTLGGIMLRRRRGE